MLSRDTCPCTMCDVHCTSTHAHTYIHTSPLLISTQDGICLVEICPCTVYIVQCTMYSVQCTVYMYTVHCTPKHTITYSSTTIEIHRSLYSHQHTHTHIHYYSHANTYTHARTRTHAHTRTYLHTTGYMLNRDMSMYIHSYLYACSRTFTHTHIHTRLLSPLRTHHEITYVHVHVNCTLYIVYCTLYIVHSCTPLHTPL